MINFKSTTSKRFELVSQVRDKDGQPTGKTKSLATDDSGELWQHYMKHKAKPKHKKRSKDKIAKDARSLPRSQEAEKIVRDMASYAKSVRKVKRNQDDSADDQQD